MADGFVITCEHGGNRVPRPYRPLFETAECRKLLDSHRGYDIGALIVARELAALLSAPLVASTTSRLLIDLNRSLGHPQLFSNATRATSAETRQRIIDQHYRPYRARAESVISQGIDRGRRVVHISCHSFTPELEGRRRNADIGLLYDPARTGEMAFCERWKANFGVTAPDLRVRRNYPYEVKNDGFTSELRRRFQSEIYIGIELEINQQVVLQSGRSWSAVRSKIMESLLMTSAGI
jgi:predicted N-formylglutamate amidohydrolase